MNISLVFVLCFSVLLRSKYASSNILSDAAKSGYDIVSGVAQKIPDAIPSADAIFSSSKNLIAGYPFEVAFKAINLFCKYFNQYRGQLSIKPITILL